MTGQAPEALAIAVLVVSADRNFQRFARAVLRQGGHTVYVTGTRCADVAVQLRLRDPHVVVLDLDHPDVDCMRRVLDRVAVVEVSDEPAATAQRAGGKWEGAPALVAAVEREANAVRRRGRLRLVTS